MDTITFSVDYKFYIIINGRNMYTSCTFINLCERNLRTVLWYKTLYYKLYTKTCVKHSADLYCFDL